MDTATEIRCPSCARLLVLRSGPAITPHYAHRPRQSCRNRPGSVPITPLRLEQLALFEVEALPVAGLTWLDPFEVIFGLDEEPLDAVVYVPSDPALDFEDDDDTPPPIRPGRRTRRHRRRRRAQATKSASRPVRRRRKAWLPRLVGWFRAQAAG